MKKRELVVAAFAICLSRLVFNACVAHAETPTGSEKTALQSEDGVTAKKEIRFDTLLEYKDVVVLLVEPDGIKIRHSDGVKKLRFELLPPEIRSQLGIQDSLAQEYRQEMAHLAKENAKKDALVQELVKQKRVVNAVIQQVTEGGVLLKRWGVYTTTEKVAKKVPYEVMVGGPTGLYPKQRGRTVTQYRTEWVNAQGVFPDVVFVSCDTSRYSVDDDFKAVIYPYGMLTYKTSRGDSKTVLHYTVDLDSAAVRLLEN